MLLYFDHAASTPPDPDVVESVSKTMQTYFGNPSALHRMGVEAERLLQQARHVVAQALQAEPQEIVFTSGGTESINLALKGAAMQYKSRGRHIVTTQIEHSAGLESCRQLEQLGFEVTYVSPDATGAVRAEDVIAAVRDDTILVSVMHVNNETGRIQPVEEIGRALRRRSGVLFHVDAVQSLGKIPVLPKSWGVDLMSVSAHKLNGPRGAGFLFCREGVQLFPLIAGGGQERGLRSGTESLPLISGMAKAVRLAVERQPDQWKRWHEWREWIADTVASLPGLHLTGTRSADEMAPHIVHFTFPGMKAEVVIHALEEAGILISTQSACSSRAGRPSRVLKAMGMPDSFCRSGLRISLGREHTADDIRTLCDRLRNVVHQLKPLAAKGDPS